MPLLIAGAAAEALHIAIRLTVLDGPSIAVCLPTDEVFQWRSSKCHVSFSDQIIRLIDVAASGRQSPRQRHLLTQHPHRR